MMLSIGQTEELEHELPFGWQRGQTPEHANSDTTEANGEIAVGAVADLQRQDCQQISGRLSTGRRPGRTGHTRQACRGREMTEPGPLIVTRAIRGAGEPRSSLNVEDGDGDGENMWKIGVTAEGVGSPTKPVSSAAFMCEFDAGHAAPCARMRFTSRASSSAGGQVDHVHGSLLR